MDIDSIDTYEFNNLGKVDPKIKYDEINYPHVKSQNWKKLLILVLIPIIIFSAIIVVVIITNPSSEEKKEKVYEPFQFALISSINEDNKDSNLIISPLFSSILLSLIANGAKNETQKEIIQVLNYKNIEEVNENNSQITSVFKSFTNFNLSSSIFTTLNLTESFLNKTEEYDTQVNGTTDINAINDWCNKTTNGKIQFNEYLYDSPFDSFESNKTNLILINAMHFFGNWTNSFRNFNNRKPFYNYLENETNVSFIYSKTEFEYYNDTNGTQFIEIPYKENNMSAIIIFPKQSNDINKYIKTMNDSILNEFEQNKNLTDIYLLLPRFEIKYTINEKDNLKKLGINKAFSDKADFSGIYYNEDKYQIDQIAQAFYFKMDKAGTELAEATRILEEQDQENDFYSNEVIRIDVNSPFLFLLKNEKLPEGKKIIFFSKIEKLEG